MKMLKCDHAECELLQHDIPESERFCKKRREAVIVFWQEEIKLLNHIRSLFPTVSDQETFKAALRLFSDNLEGKSEEERANFTISLLDRI